jgi:hypothetical protein
LEVDDIKKSNGKFGKGKKMVGRNERNKWCWKFKLKI